MFRSSLFVVFSYQFLISNCDFNAVNIFRVVGRRIPINIRSISKNKKTNSMLKKEVNH